MPTTKAHFEAIGRVAYEWSRLETFAQTMIAVLAGIPEGTALIVTNPGTIRSWMETVRRLAAHKGCPPELYKRCEKLTRQIESNLYGERNKVIHGLWSVSWQEIFGDHFPAPADLKAKVIGIKKFGELLVSSEMIASEVNAIADRIYQALKDLEWLTVTLVDALRATQPQTSS